MKPDPRDMCYDNDHLNLHTTPARRAELAEKQKRWQAEDEKKRRDIEAKKNDGKHSQP